LDAPEFMDDYYLNLLSWGSNNIISVALNKAVYLWHAADDRVQELMSMEEAQGFVTSVQWSLTDTNTLAVSTKF
jgi:cell division cycle protein 20 (cofactor of APC complex)